MTAAAPMTFAESVLTGAMSWRMSGSAPHVVAYFHRVDECLAELRSDIQCRYFLVDQIEKWEARYARFCAAVDGGEETDLAVSAWDYIETLAELDRRLARLPAAQARS